MNSNSIQSDLEEHSFIIQSRDTLEFSRYDRQEHFHSTCRIRLTATKHQAAKRSIPLKRRCGDRTFDTPHVTVVTHQNTLVLRRCSGDYLIG